MTQHDHGGEHASVGSVVVGVQTPDRPVELDDLSIDRAGEVPIGVQLAWALRARIGDGRLTAGQRLPGLRELAEMLGINANTARGVYQRLEREGLIESVQGTGTFVASTVVEPSNVGEIAADAAREAHRTGVDPRAVAAALYVAAEQSADSAGGPGERRRELRAQIAALERTLSELQSRNPELIPAAARSLLTGSGPRLLSIAELESVRDQLVHRLAVAEPLLETPSASPSGTPQEAASEASAKQPARRRVSTRPSTA